MAKPPMSSDPGRQSAMNRLEKAAKQGYGPMAPAMPARLTNEPSPTRQPIVRDEKKWKVRPDERLLKDSDDTDVSSFLAPKRPAAKKAVIPSKLALQTLNISTHTSMRATASSAGARPKSSMKPPEEVIQRQIEEQHAEEFEQMQAEAKKTVENEPHSPEDEEKHKRKARDEEVDEEELDRLEKKKEERRKREEWRKQRREDKKKQEREKARARGRQDHVSEESESDDNEDKDNPTERAKMWSSLNNGGRIMPKNLGQISDAALDKHLAELERAHNMGNSLMSEAEVLAKLKKGALNKSTGGGGKSQKERNASLRERFQASRSRSRSKKRCSRSKSRGRRR